MKTDKLSPAYFSTSEVAHYLGLSVGTVQRMVETGALKAFVTQGGHRRILSASLNQFCQAQGMSSPKPQALDPLICILHASDQVTGTLAQLSQWPQVKVITQPLDLMGIRRSIGALFIDARIAWVHAAPMHLQETSARNAHVILYNSTAMPKDSALLVANQVSQVPGDISHDLVFGYLLGSTAHAPQPSLQLAQTVAPTAETGHFLHR
jgi:excisionase family DNA binding protein